MVLQSRLRVVLDLPARLENDSILHGMFKHTCCVSEVSLSDKNLDSMVDLAWKADRLLLMDSNVYVHVLHDII